MQPSQNTPHAPNITISGITGTIQDGPGLEPHVAVGAAVELHTQPAQPAQPDIDLRKMAHWAMHYLIRTPRPHLDYEPVFQCHPLRCPPVPDGHDVVVPCDTDARMNWEWYYMREISGSRAGLDVEAAFHQRILNYVQPDGVVLAHPGCYNEGDIHKVYTRDDEIYHVWGATKVLHALAEEIRRNDSRPARVTAHSVLRRLKQLAVFTPQGSCYFPAGMGAVRPDGSTLANSWNANPAPLVEPLVNFYLASGDQEALDFAQAYAAGILAGAQPGGVRLGEDGNFGGGHGHALLHALWGVAHLGSLTGQTSMLETVKRAWDWMLSQGTGTGWFPAAPVWATDCNETCCISDMISIAALLGRAGNPQYFDYLERYVRNYIHNLQFHLTPAFVENYSRRHANLPAAQVRQGLVELAKFEGGIIGGSGLNDYENVLLGGASGFEMFGCCAPEGMRAIYTAWSATIERLADSPLGPAGVYVHLCFSRDSEWGQVQSYFPGEGRLQVRAQAHGRFYLRPPAWAPREQVYAFRGGAPARVVWSGSYVGFDDVQAGDVLTITYPLIAFEQRVAGLWKTAPDLTMQFHWLGNMVTGADPGPQKTALFTGSPRVFAAPELD
jgi:hypothetical protein